MTMESAQRTRTADHPNASLLRAGYEAFQRGDIDTVLNQFFAEDIIWHVPGRSTLAGDYRGREQVGAWFGRNFELSGGTLSLEIHDVVANDEHAVGLVRVRAQRGGRTLDDGSAQVVHIRDGKVVESWLHAGDPYAVDEFWG
jgi:ketosteroid isomerase-like protein